MRRSAFLAIGVGVSIAAAASCGTGGPPAGGSDNLPTALVGPFRILRTGETPKTAPHVLQSPWFAPTALDLDGDPSTVGVALYVVGPAKPYSVSRFELDDGRSAPRIEHPSMTIAPTEAWEMVDGIDNPFAMRGTAAHEVWMYYDSGGCLGRATSLDDGVTFTKPATPLLCGSDSPAAWESGSLSSPSVVRLSDGTYRLFYTSGAQIGEMASPDGVTFQRRPGPVLSPIAPSGELAPDAGSDTFDDVSVGDPDVVIDTTALGRPVTYVFYTGVSRLNQHAVGVAARYADDGPLERNPSPVLTRYFPRAPSVVRYTTFAMMYAAGPSSEVGASMPVINGAVAPATFEIEIPPDAATDADH